VQDAQNHVAHIALAGDYTHSTFNLSGDGRGGTFVADVFHLTPVPVASAPAVTPAISLRPTGDSFVFGRADGTGHVSQTADLGSLGSVAQVLADLTSGWAENAHAQHAVVSMFTPALEAITKNWADGILFHA
jgi:hypothetical protein